MTYHSLRTSTFSEVQVSEGLPTRDWSISSKFALAFSTRASRVALVEAWAVAKRPRATEERMVEGRIMNRSRLRMILRTTNPEQVCYSKRCVRNANEIVTQHWEQTPHL